MEIYNQDQLVEKLSSLKLISIYLLPMGKFCMLNKEKYAIKSSFGQHEIDERTSIEANIIVPKNICSLMHRYGLFVLESMLPCNSKIVKIK